MLEKNSLSILIYISLRTVEKVIYIWIEFYTFYLSRRSVENLLKLYFILVLLQIALDLEIILYLDILLIYLKNYLNIFLKIYLSFKRNNDYKSLRCDNLLF